MDYGKLLFIIFMVVPIMYLGWRLDATDSIHRFDFIPDSVCITRCPRCRSTNYTHDTPFSFTRALVGGAIFGTIGALIGGVSGKPSASRYRCYNCGHTWSYFDYATEQDRCYQKGEFFMQLSPEDKIKVLDLEKR